MNLRAPFFKTFFCRIFLCVLIFLPAGTNGIRCAGNSEHETFPEKSLVGNSGGNPADETESTVTLLAAGDNLIHDIIYMAARTAEGTYNFDPMYEHIKPLIEKAGIAFVNQETVLGGTAMGLSGYPSFNTPQEAAIGLVNAGFNVINHASNHSMDRGEKAAAATMDFWDNLNRDIADGKTAFPRNEKVTYLGFFRTKEQRENEKRIIEKKGIRFGFLSYTYGLNGYSLPPGKPWMVPLIDTEVMAEEIDALRPLCDLLVVSMHWGNEFSHAASDEQKKLVSFMADHKVDLVLGHHPHVTGPCEVITRKDGAKLTCYYSLGDFLSHTQTPWSPDTMLGALACVTVVKRGNKTAIISSGIIPTVSHYGKERRPSFTVYPLWDYTEELAAKHYKSPKINLDYLWTSSREIFGARLIEKNPF